MRLLAPLWIDPTSYKRNIVVRYIIITIPLLIFAISCSAIVYYIFLSHDNEFYKSLFYYESSFIMYIFIALYSVSVVLFTVGLYNVSKQVLRYREPH